MNDDNCPPVQSVPKGVRKGSLVVVLLADCGWGQSHNVLSEGRGAPGLKSIVNGCANRRLVVSSNVNGNECIIPEVKSLFSEFPTLSLKHAIVLSKENQEFMVRQRTKSRKSSNSVSFGQYRLKGYKSLGVSGIKGYEYLTCSIIL